MTRIAVLADIHGNIPALRAVFDDLDQQQPNAVIVGGDLVGRGPEGSVVVQEVRRRGWPVIRGNHEEYLMQFRRGRIPAEWQRDEQWAASRWMAAELSRSDIGFIEDLPFGHRPAIASQVKIVHGSPNSVNEGIGPWCSDETLDTHLQRAGAELLVCAHTHRAYEWRRPAGLIVNAGAVGLPFNRDRRAQYVVLERSAGGEWQVDFRRVAYDLAAIFEIYERTGFLREGQVTAQLLRLELEHAAPFLVPFLRWADASGEPAESGSLPAFLKLYDPDEPVSRFLSRLGL